jgi:arabinose-5-phosphate isomerase
MPKGILPPMLESMRSTLRQEAGEILRLSERIDATFEGAACQIVGCAGRTVTTGIGKAGDIAKKASSTFSSTGTPSFFLHPADALHGDLGMVTAQDIVLIYTNSGETEEILRLYPSLREIGCKTILITGRPTSTAARNSDIVLDAGVSQEACPHNLAPTSSTTVMLALSDALALAVMRERNFTKDDYALYHPSGALGRRLLLRVADAMRKGEDCAIVPPTASLRESLRAITKAGAGAALVSDGKVLLGIITDGDVRRSLDREGIGVLDKTATEVMSAQPTTVSPDMLAVEALDLFESLPTKIGELPVVQAGTPVGIVMLKDLVRLGLV